jgi:hypothetical protein
MKNSIGIFLAAALIVISCGKSKVSHDHSSMSADSANTALNSIIMEKHDEVMPKMGELYNLKKKLQDTITNTKGLSSEKKAEFETLIHVLDSANDSMMAWMHAYDPAKDSADQEKNRAYLESEIEKINNIGEQTSEAIEKAKSAIGRQ